MMGGQKKRASRARISLLPGGEGVRPITRIHAVRNRYSEQDLPSDLPNEVVIALKPIENYRTLNRPSSTSASLGSDWAGGALLRIRSSSHALERRAIVFAESDAFDENDLRRDQHFPLVEHSPRDPVGSLRQCRPSVARDPWERR